jgi:hypothetical protein
MKKSIIACTLLLTLFSITTQAQEASKHEIRVSYSDGIPTTLVDGFANALAAAFLGQKTNSKTSSFGNIGLGYRNQMTNRIRVGADITFQQEKTEITDKDNKIIQKTNSRYIMVMPTFSFSYAKTAWIDFYGEAAAGAVLDDHTQTGGTNTTSQNTIDFAFQINPIGLRVGKKIGGFLEAGFGYRGFVNLGLNYKF